MDTILVIDDEPALRHVFRLALESVPYRVIEAADGDLGIELYRNERPCLAIVDLHLPRRSGKDVIRQLLEINPQAVIVVVSGDLPEQEADIAEFARRLGAKEALEKPFRRQHLLAVVARVLKGESRPAPPAATA